MMNKAIAVLGALALTLTTTAAVQAEGMHRLSVVNAYDAPVEVYAEDASGKLHAVAHLKAGEVKTLEADLPTVDGSRIRLHVRPTDSVDWLSTWGDKDVATDRLEMSADDTAILRVAPVLAESSVEIRAV